MTKANVYKAVLEETKVRKVSIGVWMRTKRTLIPVIALLLVVPLVSAAIEFDSIARSMGIAWNAIGALFSFQYVSQNGWIQEGILKFFTFVLLLRVVQVALSGKNQKPFDSKTAGVIGFVVAGITVIFTPNAYIFSGVVALVVPLGVSGFGVYYAMIKWKEGWWHVLGLFLMIINLVFIANVIEIFKIHQWGFMYNFIMTTLDTWFILLMLLTIFKFLAMFWGLGSYLFGGGKGGDRGASGRSDKKHGRSPDSTSPSTVPETDEPYKKGRKGETDEERREREEAEKKGGEKLDHTSPGKVAIYCHTGSGFPLEGVKIKIYPKDNPSDIIVEDRTDKNGFLPAKGAPLPIGSGVAMLEAEKAGWYNITWFRKGAFKKKRILFIAPGSDNPVVIGFNQKGATIDWFEPRTDRMRWHNYGPEEELETITHGDRIRQYAEDHHGGDESKVATWRKITMRLSGIKQGLRNAKDFVTLDEKGGGRIRLQGTIITRPTGLIGHIRRHPMVFVFALLAFGGATMAGWTIPIVSWGIPFANYAAPAAGAAAGAAKVGATAAIAAGASSFLGTAGAYAAGAVGTAARAVGATLAWSLFKAALAFFPGLKRWFTKPFRGGEEGDMSKGGMGWWANTFGLGKGYYYVWWMFNDIKDFKKVASDPHNYPRNARSGWIPYNPTKLPEKEMEALSGAVDMSGVVTSGQMVGTCLALGTVQPNNPFWVEVAEQKFIKAFGEKAESLAAMEGAMLGLGVAQRRFLEGVAGDIDPQRLIWKWAEMPIDEKEIIEDKKKLIPNAKLKIDADHKEESNEIEESNQLIEIARRLLGRE